MQTTCNPEYITATFIKELKNRFLCEVEIDGEHVVCYVPSSCHLSNFLELEGKKVLLVPTQTKGSRTKYALFAAPYKRNYLLLNSSMANRAIENSINSRRFSYLGKRTTVFCEHYVSGYKCDIYIKDTDTIIEIKSVLSLEENAIFPTVFSERSITQLDKLYQLLLNGSQVNYVIVSLNPYVKTVNIAQNTPFASKLRLCMDQGMNITAFSCGLNGGEISIRRQIPVRIVP